MGVRTGRETLGKELPCSRTASLQGRVRTVSVQGHGEQRLLMMAGTEPTNGALCPGEGEVEVGGFSREPRVFQRPRGQQRTPSGLGGLLSNAREQGC